MGKVSKIQDALEKKFWGSLVYKDTKTYEPIIIKILQNYNTDINKQAIQTKNKAPKQTLTHKNT